MLGGDHRQLGLGDDQAQPGDWRWCHSGTDTAPNRISAMSMVRVVDAVKPSTARSPGRIAGSALNAVTNVPAQALADSVR